MARKAVRLAPLCVGMFLLAGIAAASASDGESFRPSDPLFLSSPLRALKVATLDLPRPLGTGLIRSAHPAAEARLEADVEAASPLDPEPNPNKAADLPPADEPAAPDATALAVIFAPAISAAPPAAGAPEEDEGLQVMPGAQFGPDLGAGHAPPTDGDAADAMAAGEDPAPRPTGTLYHDPVAVFGTDPKLFPPLAFEYLVLANHGLAPPPAPRPSASLALLANGAKDSADETPADYLGLSGASLAKAEKCMAQAIYFESRGEPKRGQIAVAQVILNRVLSGYYPKDVCGTVYQNANRRLACQFTFACDRVKDVVREPDMWQQAEEIASDMLGGRLWLDSVGRATHYHAYWVHPRWVREMRKLDRIGVHTFYRPRRWEG